MAPFPIFVLNVLSSLLIITYTSSILAYLSFLQNEIFASNTCVNNEIKRLILMILTLIILSSMILVASVVVILFRFRKGAYWNPQYLLALHGIYYLVTLVMFAIIKDIPINDTENKPIINENIDKYKKFLLNMSISYFVICAVGLLVSFRISGTIDKWNKDNKEYELTEKKKKSDNISAKYNNDKCQKELTDAKVTSAKLQEQYKQKLSDAIDESTYASQIRSGSGGMFGVPMQNQYLPSTSGGTDNSPEFKIGELKKRRLLGL